MGSGKAIRLPVFLLLPFLLFPMGCRQLVGITPRQVLDGGASGAVFLACGLEVRSATCASCLAMNCCPQAHACVADVSCARTEGCVQMCPAGDSACQIACSKKWDPVSAAQAQLRDCREGCAETCGPWDCLGSVKWQIPDPLPSTITIRATTMCGTCGPTLGPAFNPEVRVRVCSVADPECLSELATGNSDQSGNVALPFMTQKSPAAVFLEVHKDGWLDDLVMLNTPPLSYDFDVGIIHMEARQDVEQIAQDLKTAPVTIYDSNLALMKLRVSDCNLQRSSGIELTWAGQGNATIVPLGNTSDWNAVVMNLPVPANQTIRVVARKAPPTSVDGATPQVVASINLVVRGGAITLAPFVTPTPSIDPRATSGP
jgi:hypothetical protein